MSRVVTMVVLLVITSVFMSCSHEPNKVETKHKRAILQDKEILQSKKNHNVKKNRKVKKPPVTTKEQAENTRLVNGIMVLRGYFRHVNVAYAKRLVKEAREVLAMPGNSWMPIHDLIGLAINESDLRVSLETGPYYRADCGITQNHTPLFERSGKKRRELCERLKKSTKLSFIYAMKEMNIVKKQICSRYYRKPVKRKKESQKRFDRRMKRYQSKWYRCLFNTYNQGPRFLRLSCEQRINKKKYTKSEYRRRLYRCKHRGRYWIRSLCFATGVTLSKKPSKPCRWAWSEQWINRVYGIR